MRYFRYEIIALVGKLDDIAINDIATGYRYGVKYLCFYTGGMADGEFCVVFKGVAGDSAHQ